LGDFDFLAGDLVERLMLDAEEAEPEKIEKWQTVYSDLADLRGDANRSWNGHFDGKTDLLLRALEKEQAKCFAQFETYRDGGAFMMQTMLSRYWVLSSYELLRTCCDAQICENGQPQNAVCETPECQGCKVVRLKRTFAEVRMPLTKFEPQSRRGKGLDTLEVIPVLQADQKTAKTIPFKGKGKYHPSWLQDKDTGCFGWSYYDAVSEQARIISRLELSDRFLNLFD
jgi:hypothetical protein